MEIILITYLLTNSFQAISRYPTSKNAKELSRAIVPKTPITSHLSLSFSPKGFPPPPPGLQKIYIIKA